MESRAEQEIAKARGKRVPAGQRVSGVEILHPEEAGTLGAGAPSAIKAPPHKLSQWYATAICGNDITSSCLYVAAICTGFAGRLAPVCLLLVAGLLYLFRKIYGEVVGALPLNGGAYNALLNTTSKFKASIAACMTLLSYMATAVISANTAVAYGARVIDMPVLPVTVVVLAAFAVLAILGISDSARVALGIFLLHITSLVLLIGFAVVAWIAHPEVLAANWSAPNPKGYGFLAALFFGFASGLLGISGFESSANFVEEQAPGVFPKTLRNMWVAVSVFNPILALLALAVLPMGEIVDKTQYKYLLASVGDQAGGAWLRTAISIDAALVLCGAVLTSFVGVGGLVKRMTLDRCLPQFLLKTNRRGTTHRIFLLFFLLCASILVLTRGELDALAGVYTISFLGVMALFVVGNVLLKLRRRRLPRPVRAGWLSVLVALLATIAGAVGNAILDTKNLLYFMYYFVPTVLVVAVMFLRIHLLKLVLALARGFAEKVQRATVSISQGVIRKINQINSQGIIFFADGKQDLSTLNRALLYVRQNEATKRVRVVHVAEDPEKIPERLESDLRFLDEVYPEIQIEFVVFPGTFDPETIEKVSRRFQVAQNYMFIGHPSESFPFRLEELGGVRLIV